MTERGPDVLTLETVLANWREMASTLRRTNHAHEAELLDQVCDDFARAAEDYLTWLPEKQAALQSAHSVAWLRARYAGWEAQGHARRHGRVREYRALIIPRRSHAEMEYQAGARAAGAA